MFYTQQKRYLDDVAARITYKVGYRIVTGVDLDHGVWFEVQCERPDADTGITGIGHGGKRWYNPGWTTSDIVRNIYGALEAYEIHEAREFFTFDGQRVFGPHMDLEELAVHLRRYTVARAEEVARHHG